MTPEEIRRVEEIVNEQIMNCLPVKAENMPIDEARKTGAAALFGEKYGDIVRVVSMGEFSKEFCGGTHVENTGVITAFKIISETGVAAGVRRIEALTSQGLMDYYNGLERKLLEVSKLMKAKPDQLTERISHLLTENKALKSEIERLKSRQAQDAMGDVMNQVTEVKGVKDKLSEGVVVLASAANGKVSLMAMATKEAVSRGAHAGNLIREIASLVGGGGGGRPNMAQAGGKNPEGIDAAVAKVKEVLERQL